jgi:hypothetical protein
MNFVRSFVRSFIKTIQREEDKGKRKADLVIRAILGNVC